MRNISNKSCRENQNTHFMFSNLFSENRATYEITLKNIVEPEMPQMAIWRSVSCWISKATHAQAHASARTPTPTHARTNALAHKYRNTQDLLLFHSNNGFMNAPQYYVLRTLPVLF
jgi:hypothetical protein